MTVFEKLEEYLKQAIDELNKEIKAIIEKENNKYIATSLLMNCEQPQDLVNSDIRLIDKFDYFSEKDRSFMKSVIKQAIFLIKDCEGLEVQEQPQYKQVMNQLENVFQALTEIRDEKIEEKEKANLKQGYLRALINSISKDGFEKEFDDFATLLECLENSHLSEEEKNEVLQNLFVFNNSAYQEQIEKIQSITDQLFKIKEKLENYTSNKENEVEKQDETFQETFQEIETPVLAEKSVEQQSALIPAEIMDIYCEAKEIVFDNIMGIKIAGIELARGEELFAYNGAYEPGKGEYFLKNLTILKKVLLLRLYEYVEEISSCIENDTTKPLGVDEADYIKIMVEECLQPTLDDYTQYIESLEIQKTDDEDTTYDLVFLKNIEKEFNSNQLKEYYHRNQILSALRELKKGNFRSTSQVDSTNGTIYAKRKGGQGGIGGINVYYVPLKNKMILILDVLTLQDSYNKTKNIYQTNRELIKSLLAKSQDIRNRDEILALNFGIGDEINSLIEEKEKERVGGRTNE